MLYIGLGGGCRELGDLAIDGIERDPRSGAGSTGTRDWMAVSAWARDLVAVVGREQPTEHVAVFVPDQGRGGLLLAAQMWGAGEDSGAVRVGDWVVPLESSICGRVYRTGLAALCSDVAMDPDYRPFPGGRTRSSLTVPVGHPERVVAVINVEAPWVGAFSIRDYERLTERAAAAFEAFPLARAS
jgi:GAF domain-containing protein